MKNLHTFETFVPRNIEKRQEELERRTALFNKELIKTSERLQHSVNLLKDVVTEYPQEQTFIDIFKNSAIKYDLEEYPESIFFMLNGEFLTEYNLKTKEFEYSHSIYSIFNPEYSLQYNDIQTFIMHMVEKHFKIGLVTLSISNYTRTSWVEKHFKEKHLKIDL